MRNFSRFLNHTIFNNAKNNKKAENFMRFLSGFSIFKNQKAISVGSSPYAYCFYFAKNLEKWGAIHVE